MKERIATDKKINLFKSVFKGREDVYGAGDGVCVKQPVTDEIIWQHLIGKQRLGQYPLSPDILDGEGTWWAIIDIDEDDLNLCIQLQNSLFPLGITGYIERSKSKGYHVWVFFSEPVPAIKARALMRYAVDSHGQEIFPKQDTIKNDDGDYSFGNYINLPLYGYAADGSTKRTVFLNPENGCEPYDQWEFLKSVEQVSPEEIDGLIEMGELELEDDHFIPNNDNRAANNGEAYSDMLPCVTEMMMKGVSEGCRDVVAFTLAIHFRKTRKYPPAATLDTLRLWNTRNDPPLDSKVLKQKVAGAYHGRNGRGYSNLGCDNDLIKPFCVEDDCPVFKSLEKKRSESIGKPYFRGKTFVPKRLADELMSDYSFIYAGEQLYVYRGGVYTGKGEIFVRRKCRERLEEGARINRVMEVVAHITDMTYKEPDELNRCNGLTNFQNGMYDWIEDKLLPHSESYLSTIRIPVKYDPEATCPVVDTFFVTTLPPDCLYLVEELFGYCLIPDTRLEKAFMLIGTGANGKSTLLTLLEAFIGGDNITKIPLQDLSSHRFKRADLYGKLVNLFADLDARSLEGSSYFKTVVSGDAIDAERKHKDPFYFRPFAKLVFSANEIPWSRDRSFAYYRRWCIIPFPHQFAGADADRDLAAKLTQPDELSGLLNHALVGLRRLFQQGGFTESETVEKALDEYTRQNDPVRAFVNDCCEFVIDEKVERKALYNAYLSYCEAEGYKALSRPRCYNRIRMFSQVSEKEGDRGAMYFSGIRLKDDWQ